MKVFKNGLLTGLFLQLAIGPVFFFIINISLQRTLFDGLIAVLAVTIVDYFYITLAILGVGQALKRKKVKKVFGIVSSIVLIIFGAIMIKTVSDNNITEGINADVMNLMLSFTSTFILTISSPMTIVFFTSLFSAKAVEYNYAKRDLVIFGLATGLATLLFMGISVIVFSLIKTGIPMNLINILNILVGIVLIAYGLIRLRSSLIKK